MATRNVGSQEGLSRLQRVAQPEDMAQIMLFLAGPQSDFLNGETIVCWIGGKSCELLLSSMKSLVLEKSVSSDAMSFPITSHGLAPLGHEEGTGTRFVSFVSFVSVVSVVSYGKSSESWAKVYL